MRKRQYYFGDIAILWYALDGDYESVDKIIKIYRPKALEALSVACRFIAEKAEAQLYKGGRMGNRYWIDVTCPKCGHHEEESQYYAPTCGIKTCICSSCGFVIDLEQYTGITEEEASNKAEIEAIIDTFKMNDGG